MNLITERSLCDLSVLCSQVADWVGPYLNRSALWKRILGVVGLNTVAGQSQLMVGVARLDFSAKSL